MNRKLFNRLVFVILLVIISMLVFKGCELYKDREKLISQMSNYELANKSFKVKMMKDSSTIATQTQTILNQNEAIKLGLIKLDGQIKLVKSQTTQTQIVKIDSVFVPYIPNEIIETAEWMVKIRKGDTSKASMDSLLANSIVVPQKFAYEKKWINFYGKVQKNGLLMDSIRIDNESSVTIGYKKGGFLNLKKEPIVEIKNTNPYLSISKMNNVVVKDKKNILQSKLFWLGVGLVGGIFIHKL